MKTKLKAAVVAVALATAQPAFSSDTSSSIRGLILNPMGKGATDTTITIKHEPTGTVKVVKPNDAGAFVASGLRVGGPYTVTIDSAQYKDQELKEVYLELGNPFQINQVLEMIAENRVVVTASRSDFRNPNSGSSSIFSARDIANSPSIARDLKDTMRRNPLVNIDAGDGGQMSIAGNNPRFNSISVDGVRQDDDFGLNQNGYPTQRSPISIDAVEQVSVETNPFNAAEGGFSGGKISLVTKSGTNEFKGNAFYEKADGAWTGEPKEGSIDNLDEKTYGFGLGGPIIQDQVFFYVNYEKFDRSQDPALFPQENTNQQAELERIIAIAQSVYGVDIGTWSTAPVEEDEKELVKLDWEINDSHRTSFTYQHTDGQMTQGWPKDTSGTPAFDLSSNWQTKGDELTSYSAHWYADWTANFSTEVKVTDKQSDNLQIPLLGKHMGEVEITTEMEYLDADGVLRSDNRTVRFGPDKSRHANDLHNDTASFNIDAQYLRNEHTLSFGWQHEELEVFNTYIPESLGFWDFASIDDFENRIASEFRYQNADSNNANDGAASFSYTYDNFYVQDIWDYSVDWQFGFGLRFEHVHTGDRPRYNQRFVERYGFANNESLDGETLHLPRFSFKYTGVEDLIVRGGAGLFSGGRPTVWTSNAFTNDGLTIVRPQLANLDPAVYLENVDITAIPQDVLDSMQSGDGDTTPIDPDFDIPTHWQYSLAADYTTSLGLLGEDWNLAGEVIYKDIVKDVRWVDLARGQLGTTADGGRPIYGRYEPIYMNGEHVDIMMTNGEGGSSLISTFSADKAWDNGLHLNLSYTNQDIEELTTGSNSTAMSNYQYTVVLDRQNPDPATASFQTEHALKVNLDYNFELVSGYETTVSLFIQRASGRPYSYVLGSHHDTELGDPEAWGFASSDSYLPYIPTGADDAAMDYENGLSYAEIVAHLEANGISTAGGYLKRNDYRSPWNTTMDLSFSQELPGFRKDDKGEFYFVIENLLNLLDSSKGQVYYNKFGDTTKVLFDYDLNENGQYVYQTPFGLDYDPSTGPFQGEDLGDPATYRADKSVWRIKAGVKYHF